MNNDPERVEYLRKRLTAENAELSVTSIKLSFKKRD